MALNADRATKGNLGPAAAGGIIRDNRGKSLMGFTEYLGMCSSMKRETRAVPRCLKIAREMGVTRLWVHLDSKVLMGMLQGETAWYPYHRFTLEQCKGLITWRDWEVQVTHCFREANQVANRVANMGVTSSIGIIIYQHPPLEVRDLMFADCMGATWPRTSKR